MKDKFNPPWRQMAAALYAAPSDGKIYGTLDVDITDVQNFITTERKQGNKITLTHFVTAAIGRALAKVPEVNCHIRRGKLIARDYFEVMVSVNIRGGAEMAAIKVEEAHLKSVTEIASEIREKAFATRQGAEIKVMKNKYILTKIPWPLRRMTFVLLRWLVNDLGLRLGFLGFSDRSFGSVMLTNIGTHGLTTGLPALFPAAKIPAVVVMGKVEDKPVVRDGKIVVRTMLPLSAVFDHRIVDGNQAGRIARLVNRFLQDPQALNHTIPADEN